MNNFCKIVLLFMLTQAVLGKEGGEKGGKEGRVYSDEDMKEAFKRFDVNNDEFINEHDIKELEKPENKERIGAKNDEEQKTTVKGLRELIEKLPGQKMSLDQFKVLSTDESSGRYDKQLLHKAGLIDGVKYTYLQIEDALQIPRGEPSDDDNKMITIDEFLNILNTPQGYEEGGNGCGLGRIFKNLARLTNLKFKSLIAKMRGRN